MSNVTLLFRARKAILVLFFPLVISLIPAIVSNDIFRFRLAGLPVGYVMMIGFTFYLALITASYRISVNKHISLIVIICMAAVLPLGVTVDPIQHLVAAILIVFNIYFLWIGLSLGSKVNRSLLPNMLNRLWPLILICLLSYFFVERFLATTDFPNIFPFFFYRGAEGGFLLALLAIVMFEIAQDRRSQTQKITLVIVIITILALGSRTTYVAAAILLSFSLLTSSRGTIKFLIAITVVVGTVIFFMPNVAESFLRLSELPRLLTLNLDLAIIDGGSLYRIVYWTGSLDIIRENWVTGIGFSVADIQARFPSDLLEIKSSVARPHNTFLSIFMGCGLFGGVAYFSLFFGPAISLLRKFHLTKKARQPERPVVTGYVLSVVMMMAGLDVETNPQFIIIFGFTLGYIGCNYPNQNYLSPFLVMGTPKTIKK